ncbi:MAG: hypothetical protein JXR96_25610 [Deltaproteobacteria bacterium]|nr:hypothetical protein [Deltaproteobacteria bacterium]
MPNRIIPTLTVAAVLILLPAYQQAQAKPRTHDGFYLSINLGLGYYHSSAEAGGAEYTYSGLSIPTSLMMGGTLFDHLVLGGGVFFDSAPAPKEEINGTKTQADFTQLILGLGAYVDFYLNPDGGLHFPVFLGWGGLETISNGSAGGSDPTGFVMYFGAGYEWFFADEWSVGGLARLVIAPIELSGVTYLTFAPGFAASLTWH